ncbi:Methyltransferase domain-containing protein [Lachnospiraceae bacterium]|nr:Methyltransferase domain-containing protein [Lachnospiraceae bacterium]
MQTYNYELDLNTKNSNSMIINMIKPGSLVLEFGPAFGRLTKYISESLSCTVDIVEMDSESGENASKYARTACIGKINGNIETLAWTKKLAGNKYDYIIFADVLEHLHNPGDVLRVCCGFLKKDGEILCSVPNIAHSSIIISLWNNDFTYQNVGLLDQTHVHFFTRKTFELLARENGLEPISIESISVGVGGNEIRWIYDSLPEIVNEELRLRDEGDAYQYIFRLKRQIDINNEAGQVLNVSSVAGYVCECFFKKDSDTEFTSLQRIQKKYNSRSAKIYFDLNNIQRLNGLCVKLLPCSALIRIINISWDSCDIPYTTNGNIISENIYAFLGSAEVFITVPEVNHQILYVEFEIITTFEKYINMFGHVVKMLNQKAEEEKNEIRQLQVVVNDIKQKMNDQIAEREIESQRFNDQISFYQEKNQKLNDQIGVFEEERAKLNDQISFYQEENQKLNDVVLAYEEKKTRSIWDILKKTYKE